MNLKRLVDEKFLMTMDQSVELVRAGPKKSDTLTLTCDRLEATLERRIENADAPKVGTQPAFNLGGSSEVQRVRGIGRCFIRTADYDVECEEFDYNVVTQIAEMRASWKTGECLAKGTRNSASCGSDDMGSSIWTNSDSIRFWNDRSIISAREKFPSIKFDRESSKDP